MILILLYSIIYCLAKTDRAVSITAGLWLISSLCLGQADIKAQGGSMFYFIVNPSSHSGNGIHIWRRLEPELKLRRAEYEAFLTEKEFDARNEAARLTSESGASKTIVVIGGDGTMNEVLTGIRSLSKAVIGYIPAGSSNDLARALKLPSDPLVALETVLKPNGYLKMDVGRIEAEGCIRRFSVSAGMGFDAAVCHEALSSKLKGKLNRIGLGKLTYGLIALKQLARLPRTDTELTLDGTRKIRLERFIFAAIMNNKYEGGGFNFSPKAKNNDRHFDICAAEKISRLKIFFILPFAFFGKHEGFNGIKAFRAEKIRLVSDVPCAVHADGESCGVCREVTVSMEPEQIRIIV